ncbi:hypothetical protein BDY24DRAFT_45986 [Mrakia frigida]|uniref:uncharacterized protein n=1 Tax=Mrakia frigida TaxID=29902 RepID=UPI003FCC24E7
MVGRRKRRGGSGWSEFRGSSEAVSLLPLNDQLEDFFTSLEASRSLLSTLQLFKIQSPDFTFVAPVPLPETKLVVLDSPLLFDLQLELFIFHSFTLDRYHSHLTIPTLHLLSLYHALNHSNRTPSPNPLPPPSNGSPSRRSSLPTPSRRCDQDPLPQSRDSIPEALRLVLPPPFPPPSRFHRRC